MRRTVALMMIVIGSISIVWAFAFGFQGHLLGFHYSSNEAPVSSPANRADIIFNCGSPFAPNSLRVRVLTPMAVRNRHGDNSLMTGKPFFTRECQSLLATRRKISGAAGMAGLVLVGLGIHFSLRRGSDRRGAEAPPRSSGRR